MDRREILAKLSEGSISPDEADKLLLALEAKPKRGLYCKVSEKKALSVYGLQRMPVTLYAEQWERLLDFADEIRKFIAANDAELDRRDRTR